MKKYNVLGRKDNGKWETLLENSTKASANKVAKEWELSGGTAEVWAVENKGGAQITYKVK